MAIRGPQFNVDNALPVGLDAGRILNFSMRDGITGPEIVANAAAQLGVVNEDLMQQWGGLLYLTRSDHAMRRQGDGTRTMTPKNSEGALPDPVHGELVGQMLPLEDYKDALAWSEYWLRDAWQELVDADIQIINERWRSRVEYDILTRIFTDTENLIGAAGYDVPWARGSGVTIPYIPPAFSGYQFSTSHTHFLAGSAAVSTTSTAASLEAAMVHLRHHGFGGRLVALVSEADLASYTGIAAAKFVKLQPQGITVVAGNSGAPVNVVSGELQGIAGELFGMYMGDRGVVELRYHSRIPTGYLFMTKSYGVNHPKNGLALREHPAVGFGMAVNPLIDRSLVPKLDYVEFKATHGVGINDRLNGVVVDIVNASYTNPTIS